MLLTALTGNIASGKSTVAASLVRRGATLIDSDVAAREAVAPGTPALAAIVRQFGTVMLLSDGALDRPRLGRLVFGDTVAREALEAIVHPAVAGERATFLAANADAPLVVLDVPLLFEAGGWQSVDKIAVVSAPADVQRARVLARPGMTVARFAAILAKQLPDAEKRARADVVIPTGGSLEETRAVVRAVIACLGAATGR